MPEGHTVHRVARLFVDVFVGHEILASSPQGRFASGAKVITGHQLVDSKAKGKQLFLRFDNDQTVRVHLGIYGAWDVWTNPNTSPDLSHELMSWGAPRSRRRRLGEREGSSQHEEIFPPEPVGQVRLRLETDRAVADLRGPTACEVLTPDDTQAVLARLGPDPLVDGGKKGESAFVANVLATRRPIGLVLMDQSVVSGIGNVYRAEILFRHRLNPYLPAAQLSEDQAVELWRDWKVLLTDGVKTGVMLTRNDMDQALRKKALRSGKDRYFVYKREGQPCRACGTHIVMDLMAARKLYFCPVCQEGTTERTPRP
jgi:endonuclease VIII